MIPDYHSDDFSTARLEDPVSLRSAAGEARATLYTVLNRLERNDLEGEDQQSIDDCLGALAILEEALR
ncbi:MULTISPECIES: hypothetical protein [Halocynthiibacter]|uniref:Uncharacterized protein n=1 Tax=Halocynthiibacter halioticoli TaxID=2986804 RepID=A0AAE3J1L8_9RHOB|nr:MULTISPECIES: hypothetical protein [Halocynthiibacter]MCV6825065.1 hypothetical protein [Halocynthiibacter halioticoli]MCW4058066.1 hypothetical protein [Halocynthiibacter sp. SDUM655004]